MRVVRALAVVLLLVSGAALSDTPPPEPEGFWTGPINSPVPATIAGGEVIDAQQLQALLDASDPLVIDVSNTPTKPAGLAADTPWLPLPQQVIPGAVWLPGVGMGELSAESDRFFREYLAQATRGNREHRIVIYCHERCWLSWNAAKRAIGYGYRRVHWMPDGVEGWRAAGFKTIAAQPTTASADQK